MPRICPQSPIYFWVSQALSPELRASFHLVNNMFLFSPVCFKGSLSLLEILLFFPGGLSKWKSRCTRVPQFAQGRLARCCLWVVFFHGEMCPNLGAQTFAQPSWPMHCNQTPAILPCHRGEVQGGGLGRVAALLPGLCGLSAHAGAAAQGVSLVHFAKGC